MKQINYDTNKKNRGKLARQYLQDVFTNPGHPMYAASDVQFAKKLNVTRLTVINIRKDLNIKSRYHRIVDLLKSIDTRRYTITKLSEKIGLKYQNTYQLIKKHSLQTQQDKPPIESMLEHNKRRHPEIYG